ncbi:unnamed protein product [Allacma fusca]|uniref:Uncharacterized protein n=1 Tax=Allacma fusca TaxID=39272 RepID=A0A8J2PG67_9HEXA|nr:unnamed protein product [Allacma fusca]
MIKRVPYLKEIRETFQILYESGIYSWLFKIRENKQVLSETKSILAGLRNMTLYNLNASETYAPGAPECPAEKECPDEKACACSGRRKWSANRILEFQHVMVVVILLGIGLLISMFSFSLESLSPLFKLVWRWLRSSRVTVLDSSELYIFDPHFGALRSSDLCVASNENGFDSASKNCNCLERHDSFEFFDQ